MSFFNTQAVVTSSAGSEKRVISSQKQIVGVKVNRHKDTAFTSGKTAPRSNSHNGGK